MQGNHEADDEDLTITIGAPVVVASQPRHVENRGPPPASLATSSLHRAANELPYVELDVIGRLRQDPGHMSGHSAMPQPLAEVKRNVQHLIDRPHSNMTFTKRWAMERGAVIKPSDPVQRRKALTHACLNGGSYVVPWDRYNEFLYVMAMDIECGNNIFVSEIGHEVFRLFMDIDLNGDDPDMLRQEGRSMMGTIHHAVCQYFPSLPPEDAFVVVCAAPIRAYENGKYKLGVHYVWPHLLVNSDQALRIRESIIAALRKDMGNRQGEFANGWQDAVDLGVLTKRNLRVLGTKKMEKCKVPNCPYRKALEKRQREAKRRPGRPKTSGDGSSQAPMHDAPESEDHDEQGMEEPCGECHGKGRVVVDRVYHVVSVLDGLGNRMSDLMREMNSDTFFRLQLTTIRVDHNQTTAAYRVPPNAPAFASIESMTRRSGKVGRMLEMRLDVREQSDDDSEMGDDDVDENGAKVQPLQPLNGYTRLPGDEIEWNKLVHSDRVYVDPQSTVITQLQHVIADYHHMYRELEILEMCCDGKRTAYFVRVGGPNSNFCLNRIPEDNPSAMGGYHTSNNIYFEVKCTRGTAVICQRCFSGNEMDQCKHRFGPCKKFRGRPLSLPQNIAKALFPQLRKKKTAGGSSAVMTTAGARAANTAEIQESANLMRRDIQPNGMLNPTIQSSSGLHAYGGVDMQTRLVRQMEKIAREQNSLTSNCQSDLRRQKMRQHERLRQTLWSMTETLQTIHELGHELKNGGHSLSAETAGMATKHVTFAPPAMIQAVREGAKHAAQREGDEFMEEVHDNPGRVLLESATSRTSMYQPVARSHPFHKDGGQGASERITFGKGNSASSSSSHHHSRSQGGGNRNGHTMSFGRKMTVTENTAEQMNTSAISELLTSSIYAKVRPAQIGYDENGAMVVGDVAQQPTLIHVPFRPNTESDLPGGGMPTSESARRDIV